MFGAQSTRLDEILLAKGLIGEADIEAATDYQKQHGGVFGESLIALGILTQQQLDEVLWAKPKAPRSLEDTGLTAGQLQKFLIKAIYAADLQTPSQMRDYLMLPASLVNKLIDEAASQKLISSLGTATGSVPGELAFGLSAAGRQFAVEAFEQNGYVGPVPVSLHAYQERIIAQKITNERVNKGMIDEAFSDLVVTETFIRNIGPGINSGKCILLYGPPGNGKTSLAERIGALFETTICVPYAVDIDGNVMKVYDPSLHKEVQKEGESQGKSVMREDVDKRWVPCKRPVVMVGGELTLSMLDLEFNAISKFYEAPIHLKALGGTFIIDDFGRQFVKPTDLLNRWIVPLESRVDFMKLHSGKSFAVPFDELIIFATNMSPADLMDPAFLRRIPYKIETVGPSHSDFQLIFERVAENYGLTMTDEILHFVIEEIIGENGMDLAAYQPRFICEHVVSACKFEGQAPNFCLDEIRTALNHLCVKDSGKLRNLADAA